MKVIDMLGQRFGRLLVVARAEKNLRGGARWRCLCDCGKTTVLLRQRLRTGHTQSCGCYQREQLGKRSRVHGRQGSLTWRSWQNMITRCYNPNVAKFKYYGGRGITVCDRWRESLGFVRFLADMGERPSFAHSIDRFPNIDGNYEPTNCRWATRSQQSKNRRPFAIGKGVSHEIGA
jgi:hypothetical protein